MTLEHLLNFLLFLNPPVVVTIVVFLAVGSAAHGNSNWGHLAFGWGFNIIYLYSEVFTLDGETSSILGFQIDSIVLVGMSVITASAFLEYSVAFKSKKIRSWQKQLLSYASTFLVWGGSALITWWFIGEPIPSSSNPVELSETAIALMPQIFFEAIVIMFSAYCLQLDLTRRGVKRCKLVTIPWFLYGLMQFAYFVTIHLGDMILNLSLFAFALILKGAIGVGLIRVYTEQAGHTKYRITRDVENRMEERVRRELGEYQNIAFSWFAHELKNPAFAIRTMASVIKRRIGQKEFHRAGVDAEKLVPMTRTLVSVVESVKIAAEPLNVEKLEFFSVNDCVEEAVQAVKASYQERINLNASLNFAQQLTVCGVRASLVQVFSNVIRNGVEATLDGFGVSGVVSPSPEKKGGASKTPLVKLHIRTRRTIFKEYPFVSIKINDFGPGISQEEMERIFEAYYSTKSGVNRGIGLWVVRNFVETFAGHITLSSPLEKGMQGTSFEIWFPRVAELNLWFPEEIERQLSPLAFWRRAKTLLTDEST